MRRQPEEDSQAAVDVLARIVATTSLGLLSWRSLGGDFESWSQLDAGMAGIAAITVLLILLGRQLGFWAAWLLGLAQLVAVAAEPTPFQEFFRAPLLTWPLLLLVTATLLLWIHRERRTDYLTPYERHPQY